MNGLPTGRGSSAPPAIRPAKFAPGDTLHPADGRSFVCIDDDHWEGRGPFNNGNSSSTRLVISYLSGARWRDWLLRFEPAPVEEGADLPGTALTDLPSIPPDSLWLPYQADPETPRLTLLRESMRQDVGETLGMPYTMQGHEVTAALSILRDTTKDSPDLEMSQRPESGALYARWRPPSTRITTVDVTTVAYIPAVVDAPAGG